MKEDVRCKEVNQSKFAHKLILVIQLFLNEFEGLLDLVELVVEVALVVQDLLLDIVELCVELLGLVVLLPQLLQELVFVLKDRIIGVELLLYLLLLLCRLCSRHLEWGGY